jgi:hypothetical protein
MGFEKYLGVSTVMSIFKAFKKIPDQARAIFCGAAATKR